MFNGLNHQRFTEAGLAVIVTIIHQGLESQLNRMQATAESEADVGRVGALLHPDPFFEQGVRKDKIPNRHGSIEIKVFDVTITVWVNGPIHPTISGEIKSLAVILRSFIQLGE